jgi:hypothetical protein
MRTGDVMLPRLDHEGFDFLDFGDLPPRKIFRLDTGQIRQTMFAFDDGDLNDLRRFLNQHPLMRFVSDGRSALATLRDEAR